MSKMGDWVIDLQQDMVDLTREQFVAKHGDMFGYLHDEFLGMNVVEFIGKERTDGESRSEG
jgi:hypothetical protein